jgi:hypothetical protein
LAALVSCNKETAFPENSAEPATTPQDDLVTISIRANVENPVTRVSAADEGASITYTWQAGDEIKVLYEGGSTTATAAVSDGVATFSLSVPDGATALWMVYPSSLGASIEGGRLKINMPAVQKDVLPAVFVANCDASAESVTFRHPVSWYKIVVDGDGTDVTRLILSSAGDNALSASAMALDFNSGVPSVYSRDNVASEVTLDFSGAGTYYLPIMPDVAKTASDLTFQFYRGEAKTEKAGAYWHAKDLADERGSLVNWGSLPAKATNRYVSTSGSSSNNGATADKPWDLATFKGFMENSSSRDAATLALYDGVNIRLAAGTYSLSAKIAPNISIRTNIIGHSAEDTFIDGSSNKLLFDIYKQTGEFVTFKNITFQGGRNSNDGGAFRIGNSSREFTIVFDNCRFIKNSITTAGKYGGAFYMCANSEVTFNGCTFGDGTDAGKNYAPAGGALYATGNAKLNLNDCTFKFNQATGSAGDGGGACIFANSTNVIKINHCSFVGNTAGSRGVIRVNDNVLVYLNGVSFNGNTTTEGSNPWGVCIHGGNSFFCMNNVTSFGNYNTENVTSNSCAFNCDRGFIITNSTLIDRGGQYEVRINDIYKSVYQKIHNLAMCNNIISNESAPNYTFWVRGSITLNNYGHNVRGSGAAQGNVLDSTPATDKYGQTHSVLGGTYSDGVYSWSGTIAGFTPATAADVENAIKACTVSMAGVSNVGSDFYAWLKEIGALGKDARGVTRGTPWWPGAYQN